MTRCEPQLLYQAPRLCIARCQHCHRITVMFVNLLAGFSPPDFDNFCRNMTQTDFDDYSTPFPDSEPHLVLHTCHDDIQFTFNRSEFEQLQRALTETQLLLEAQHILHASHE